MLYHFRLFLTLFAACGLTAAVYAQTNQVPVIQNLQATANWPAKTLTLTYDVADAENDALDITVEFSNDGGKSFNLSSKIAATGDIGFPIQPGSGKTITCALDSLAGLPGAFTVRLTVDDQQPFDIQHLVNEVDSTRLRNDLSFVEGIRHRTTGAAHLEDMRDSLRHLYGGLGLRAEDHTFNFSGYTGRNIIGHQPGLEAAQRVVIVDAHYDSMQNAPGADDNGSGTVGQMEIARLLSRYPTRKTVRYIGFDLEEAGLKGSLAYVNVLPATDTIEGVLNFEMIGYYSEAPNSQTTPMGFNALFPDVYAQLQADMFRGNFITNVGNTTDLAARFQTAATQYVPGLKVYTLVPTASVPDLSRSDHAAFWAKYKPALMLTDGAEFRNACYHKACDTLERLNFTFMRQVVQATLATAADLAGVIHGDWATTSFDAPVGTKTPVARCLPTITQQPGSLFFNFGGCPPVSGFWLEILDGKGAQLHKERITTQGKTTLEVALPQLPAGVLFAKMTWSGGIHAERIVIP